jgi:hypothetical protein
VAAKQDYSGMLPGNTKVEMIAIRKKTGQAYKKIIELQEFKTIEKKEGFEYLPQLYQIGFSQFKDAIEI